MKKSFDFHDASIVRLEYLRDKNSLQVGIILDNSNRHELTFIDVVGWDFSPFEFQNFLLDFRMYEHSELSASLIDDYDVNPKYLNIMKESGGYLFELDPASGLGGYVVAKELIIS